MASQRPLFALVSTLALTGILTGPAWAQDTPKIEGFLTDPIEVYDENEDYIDDYDVGGIDLNGVKVMEENGDLVKLKFGAPYADAWVFKTDVEWPSECRETAGAKVTKAKNASTMGLGGDLCE